MTSTRNNLSYLRFLPLLVVVLMIVNKLFGGRVVRILDLRSKFQDGKDLTPSTQSATSTSNQDEGDTDL